MSCPICNKPTEPVFKPFCSDRCRLVDLGKWLTGSYAVAQVEDDEDDIIDGEDVQE